MLYIIDNNGFYLGLNTQKAVEEQGLLFVTTAPPIELIKAKWNGIIRTYKKSNLNH
jgi:hypothetical protein